MSHENISNSFKKSNLYDFSSIPSLMQFGLYIVFFFIQEQGSRAWQVALVLKHLWTHILTAEIEL